MEVIRNTTDIILCGSGYIIVGAAAFACVVNAGLTIALPCAKLMGINITTEQTVQGVIACVFHSLFFAALADGLARKINC